ncbi:cytosine/purines uracil thiamine allantoin permease [Arthrobacter crystallopoietes BAB-32]|uniref:Cytosine/purines uracil thiamine allantoin permease n=1 Tax=Arthrobacter crystallopoietes BAB-32 TaxID=1246476 RepID=N1UVR9_9MICC|nr:cytosine permease [Arthrobacter crystallopoietes]EMY33155.1 cytosine/purines uracil thiamine allantoin permease [Arthrobacter crystallopoietes BAB-32]
MNTDINSKAVEEDSVAEDRGYRDSLTKIEPYGIEHIPDVERHGKPRSQFFLWFAAGMNFPLVVLGFSAAYFGLPFWSAVVAILGAGLVAAAVMGYLSGMGVRLGIPQQMQARGPLGFIGNLLPVAYVNVFAGVGWAAVTVILGGQAIGLLTGMPFWLSALVLMLLQLGVAVMGYNLIHFLQRVLSFVLLAGFIFVTVVTVASGSIVNTPNPEAEGFQGVGGWIIFFGYFFSYIVAWMPFASDYSRYLPNSAANRRGAGWFTMLGNFVTLSWMGILGALLGSTATSTDTIAALDELMGPWAIIGLGIVALSSFTQNFLNVYGGAISIQTMGIPVSRHIAVVFICIASYLVALWGQHGFYEGFTAFLNLTAYCIAPYVTVLIFDYLFGGRRSQRGLQELYDKSRKFEWGFVAWAAGVVGSSPFWISAVYTGPIAAAFPQIGDLSFYVGALIAALVYLATYKLPRLSKQPLLVAEKEDTNA